MRRYFKNDPNYDGDNWLVADFGVETDGTHHYLTTHCVRASELHSISDGAKADAELVAMLLNWYYNMPDAKDVVVSFDKALCEAEAG